MTNLNGKKIIFVIGGPGSGKGSAIKIQLYGINNPGFGPR